MLSRNRNKKVLVKIMREIMQMYVQDKTIRQFNKLKHVYIKNNIVK